MKRRPFLAILLASCAASAGWAQVPDGVEFQANTYTTDWQSYPSMSADAAGNFVVVWTSASQDGGRWGGIFGQRFTRDGARRGIEFQVNAYTTGTQQFSAVAADPSGNFVVAWESYQDGSRRGIFAQRFSADGTPRGGEFRVNTYTTGDQRRPFVASDALGGFLVVWGSETEDVSHRGVTAQRYGVDGAPLGGEFLVDTYASGSQWPDAVAFDPAGRLIIVWYHDGPNGSSFDVFARRYDAGGSPIGSPFQINTSRAPYDSAAVATDPSGGFVLAWNSAGLPGGSGLDVAARMFDSAGLPRGPEFRVNTYTYRQQLRPTVVMNDDGHYVVAWYDEQQGGIFGQAFDASGQLKGGEFRVNQRLVQASAPSSAPLGDGKFVVTWQSYGQDGSSSGVFGQRFANAIMPVALAVDTVPSQASDGNLVLEPGESADVRPSWHNLTGAAQTFDGLASSFTGPPAMGVSYELLDDVATYGTVADGGTITCAECYGLRIGFGGVRPFTHWDAVFTEQLTTGQTKPWTLHVGQSFGDVPRSSPFYRDVETLVHHSVTAGCTIGLYCPSAAVTREQMAVFALVAFEGPDYVPWTCELWPPMFGDVPVTSFFCPWIQELARRGVVGGCGGGNFCPQAAVTREQMPVFVLRLLDPALDPPACTTPRFADVPASSPFCRWIEELARRGVVGGCGGGNYCPTAPVTREQMATFLTGTYGLTLYGP